MPYLSQTTKEKNVENKVLHITAISSASSRKINFVDPQIIFLCLYINWLFNKKNHNYVGKNNIRRTYVNEYVLCECTI